jgi:hypothetical protein
MLRCEAARQVGRQTRNPEGGGKPPHSKKPVPRLRGFCSGGLTVGVGFDFDYVGAGLVPFYRNRPESIVRQPIQKTNQIQKQRVAGAKAARKTKAKRNSARATSQSSELDQGRRAPGR